MFITGHMPRNKGLQISGVLHHPGFCHHKRHGYFPCVVISPPHHSDIGDGGMGLQQRLQFGRGHLKAFVFDQFFQPVDDEQIAICINPGDIASAQPAIGIQRRGSGGGVVQITLHRLRPAHPQLAHIACGDIQPGFGVNDPALGQGQGAAGRPRQVMPNLGGVAYG